MVVSDRHKIFPKALVSIIFICATLIASYVNCSGGQTNFDPNSSVNNQTPNINTNINTNTSINPTQEQMKSAPANVFRTSLYDKNFIYSNMITVEGLISEATIKLVGSDGAALSIDKGPWIINGSVQNGQKIQLRMNKDINSSISFSILGKTYNWNRVVFYSGPSEFTVPDNMTKIFVTVIGGGGGGASGGGYDVGYGSVGGGGGGGGGQYAILDVSPGHTFPIFVGYGGKAGKNNCIDPGGNGQNSLFGTLVSGGGNGGSSGFNDPDSQSGTAGQGGEAGIYGVVGGHGGYAQVGNGQMTDGNFGANGIIQGDDHNGGFGAGGGSSGSNCFNKFVRGGKTSLVPAGNGGSSGEGAQQAIQSIPAQHFGGGGMGGSNCNICTSGEAGAPGIVIIEY